MKTLILLTLLISLSLSATVATQSNIVCTCYVLIEDPEEASHSGTTPINEIELFCISRKGDNGLGYTGSINIFHAGPVVPLLILGNRAIQMCKDIYIEHQLENLEDKV